MCVYIGSGKSSMLRALRGLWSPLSGSATLCCDDNVHCIMFVPQKPYLTLGSLADQVQYELQLERGKFMKLLHFFPYCLDYLSKEAKAA